MSKIQWESDLVEMPFCQQLETKTAARGRLLGILEFLASLQQNWESLESNRMP